MKPDYYAVFKSITQYSTWDLDNLLKLNNLKDTRADRRKLNSKSRIIPVSVFKTNRDQIERHDSDKGIPQGSAISACLANIYMLEIDKKISDFVKMHGGMYRRYSDDFIIILPTEEKTQEYLEQIIKRFNAYHNEGLLELQPRKTQVFRLDRQGDLENIGHLFEPKLNELKRNINFLGFSFDGKHVTLRGKTIDEAKEIIKTFIEMIKREITDDAELEKLEEAIAFKNVSNMPARVKCALLAWHTLEDMIEKGETDGKISSSCCH